MATKSKKSNWSKIWQQIADAYNTEPLKRTDRQGNITCLGLCDALFSITGCYPKLKRKNKMLLVARLFRDLNPRAWGGYWWFTNEEGDKNRAIFAGFMAAMGNRGFEELISVYKN